MIYAIFKKDLLKYRLDNTFRVNFVYQTVSKQNSMLYVFKDNISNQLFNISHMWLK